MHGQMRPKRRFQPLAALPATSQLTSLAAAVWILGQLVSTSSVSLLLLGHSIWKQKARKACKGEELPYLLFLISCDGELWVPISLVLHSLKIELIERTGKALEPNLPSSVFPEVPSWIAQWREGVSVLDGRDSMAYESPAVQYRGALDDVLRRLLPLLQQDRPGVDLRIMKLLHFIDGHDGHVGWDLDGACRELRLDISGAYAARLFKRCTGLGVREYAKKKRLLMAAERLKITNLPVKVIAAEFGYQSLPHFTRRFKEQFRLSPTEFRKGQAA